jgi:hypothetical protein
MREAFLLLHLLWNLFKETGEINTYMFYKALENIRQVNVFNSTSDSFEIDGILDIYPEENEI